MSASAPSDRASLRKLASAILPTAADMEAFCLDYFPDVAARFAGGQSRLDRDNLLLQLSDSEQLADALKKHNPRRYSRYMRLLAPPPSSPADAAAKNPYRGLSAFQAEESDLFFGRDELTEQLWLRFKTLYSHAGATRVLAVLGPSGSGKSSVARAGLLAELKSAPIPGPHAVNPIVLKPGGNPLLALAMALQPPIHQPPAAEDLSAQRDLAEFLRKPNASGQFDGLSLWAANRLGVDASPFVVLVDQFEEVYALCSAAHERDAFVNLLLHAAADRTRHVSVVLTLRSDFLGETHRQHSELNRLISGQAVIVGAMSREELSQAITAPAAQTGQPIDEAAVQLLVSQAWGNEGALPLLEFTLMRIWEGMQAHKKPGETLRELGGVGGALAGEAQKIYQALSQPEQAIARRAFFRLVRLGEGTRDTRRRAPLSELCGRGDTETSVLATLRKFASDNARLVTLGYEQAELTAEVTHEALFDHWIELRTWIAQGREDRALHDRALAAAKLWNQDGRPTGRLWRPPDMTLLTNFQRRRPEEFGPILATFLTAAVRRRRQEQLLSLGAVGVVIAALLVATGLYAARERHKAQEAVAANERVLQQLLDSQVERGRQLLLESGASSEALLWLHRARVQNSKHPSLPILLKEAMRRVDPISVLIRSEGDSDSSAVFSPNGRYLLTTATEAPARLWDVATGRLAKEFGSPNRVEARAALSPDGRRLITLKTDGTPEIWDTSTGQMVVALQRPEDGETESANDTFESTVNIAVFSPNGSRIVTVSRGNTAQVWQTATGRLAVELKGHTAAIRSVAFSPEGERVVTASEDKTARVWQAGTGLVVTELKGHESSVSSAAFSPDGQRIVTASSDRIVRIWQAATGATLGTLNHPLLGGYGTSNVAKFSPDGGRIVATTGTSIPVLWDARTGRLLAELKGQRMRVHSVSFSPDGRHIVAASEDHAVCMWDAESGQLRAVLRGHEGRVDSAAFSPDGRRIVTASQDKSIRVWDVDKVLADGALRGYWVNVHKAAFSPDGRHVVTAHRDRAVRVWDVTTGRQVHELADKTDPYMESILAEFLIGKDEQTRVVALDSWGGINSVAFSPDGQRIVVGSSDRVARVWQADTGRLLASFHRHTDRVMDANFSKDGRWIATTSQDGIARVWDVDTEKLIAQNKFEKDADDWRFSDSAEGTISATFSPNGSHMVMTGASDYARVWEVSSGKLMNLAGHADRVRSAVYSPNGQRIVTASADRTARVWDAATGRLQVVLRGHSEGVNSATFSPDGNRIVTASSDATAWVWNGETGLHLAELRGHTASINSASFSDDGQRIVTASQDGTVRVWEADTGRVIAERQSDGTSVQTASLSSDGSRILTVSKDYAARLWDLGRETRTPEQLDKIIRCRSSAQFENDGSNVIVSRPSPPEGCQDTARSHP